MNEPRADPPERARGQPAGIGPRRGRSDENPREAAFGFLEQGG